MLEVTTAVGWLIAGAGVVGSAVGWFVREVWGEWLVRQREDREENRTVRAKRHERQMQVAEHALTQLHTTIGPLAGMLRAWRGEIVGKVRAEMVGSVIQNAQERMSRLSEDSHHAIRLLRFYFGPEISRTLSESDRDGDEVVETLSEFMTKNDLMLEFARYAEEQLQAQAGKIDEAAIRRDLKTWFDDDTAEQVKRLDRVIELVEKRQRAVEAVEDMLRERLWAEAEKRSGRVGVHVVPPKATRGVLPEE